MLAVKPSPRSSEVGLDRGREREWPWVLERVARREGGFRLDDSPSRTQRHTCLVLSAENKLEDQNDETKSSTRERRYLTCLLLPHKPALTLVEGSSRVARG